MTNAETLIKSMLAALSTYAIESMKSTSILFVPLLLFVDSGEGGVLAIRGDDRIDVRFASILPNLVIIVVIKSRDREEHDMTRIAVNLMSFVDWSCQSGLVISFEFKIRDQVTQLSRFSRFVVKRFHVERGWCVQIRVRR